MNQRSQLVEFVAIRYSANFFIRQIQNVYLQIALLRRGFSTPDQILELSVVTIRYDTVYLTCSKKLTDSQLSLPHGINKKLKMTD